MIKSSCQLKMKAVFLSLLFLSVVVCNPFHLKDEQGKKVLLIRMILFWLYNEVETYKYVRDIQVSN